MPKELYPIPGTVEETERLIEQGRVYETALGYQIHPKILAGLPPGPRIADIGTNSGDYLVRLAKDFPPDASFHGFDISSASFYGEDKLPRNVQLHIQDVLEPFPAQFHGTFDFLHLRLLVIGFQQDDWTIAVKNLAQLLRPGGAIQWVENDVMGSRILRSGKSGSSITNLEQFFYPLRESFKNRFKFGYSDLPGLLEGVGLERVEQDVVSSDRVIENRELATTNVIGGVLRWATFMDEDTRLKTWSGHDVPELAREAYKDVQDGAYWRIDIFASIGFKPGE